MSGRRALARAMSGLPQERDNPENFSSAIVVADDETRRFREFIGRVLWPPVDLNPIGDHK